MASNYNSYGAYGGNPYQAGAGQNTGYGDTSNPYGAHQGYGAGNNQYGGNPYGQPQQQSFNQQPHAAQPPYPVDNASDSRYGRGGYGGYDGPNEPNVPVNSQQNIEYVQPGPSVMSDKEFLGQVEAIKKMIRELTTNVDNIASLHQSTLNSTDARSSGPLESLVTDTQVKNTMIREQIKKLEIDAARSRTNQVKDTQVKQLKTSFTNQLQLYRQEEAKYEQRYREQIARQYRIVNPQATEAEVAEATQADWGNEGVFQTALKSNRSATANTVLGSVRARHNDIQKIERTMIELNQIMQDLATTIVLQDTNVAMIEDHTAQVEDHTRRGNVELDKGVKSARRARRNKWICFWICVAIIVIIAAVLGAYFGTQSSRRN